MQTWDNLLPGLYTVSEIAPQGFTVYGNQQTVQVNPGTTANCGIVNILDPNDPPVPPGPGGDPTPPSPPGSMTAWVKIQTITQGRTINSSDSDSDDYDYQGGSWSGIYGHRSYQSSSSDNSTLEINDIKWTSYPADVVPLPNTWKRTYNYNATSSYNYSGHTNEWEYGWVNYQTIGDDGNNRQSSVTSNFTTLGGMSGYASYPAVCGKYESHSSSSSWTAGVVLEYCYDEQGNPYTIPTPYSSNSSSSSDFSASTANGDPCHGSDGNNYSIASLTAETVDLYGATLTNQNFTRGHELDGTMNKTTRSGHTTRTDYQNISTQWYKCTKNQNGDWSWTPVSEGF